MKRILGVSLTLLVAIAAVAMTTQLGEASDHDDGEVTGGAGVGNTKDRARNLTDHFAFKSPAAPDELALIMYFNPRSLPGRQYFLGADTRYEFNVAKVGAKTEGGKVTPDYVFRFEAQGAPNAMGVQMIKLTILENVGGTLTERGTMTGSSTDFATSKANTNLTINANANVGNFNVRWFAGQRADSFHFDVVRFFEVRAFLAQRFFGKGATRGDAAAGLSDNCRGDKFLALALPGGAAANEANGTPDHDVINLFNPPSCAPDFTKNLNVTAIVLNVKIANLGGGTVFDTWSSISTLQDP
jgi:hypothetical protein